MLSNLYTYENEDQISIDLKCSICLSPFHSPFCDLHCGHMFCFLCLETWISQNQSCPICRRNFTKFVPVTDEKLRNKLDDLLVQCVHCNKSNIKRGYFNKHATYTCSKRIVIDQEEEDEESLEDRLNFLYLLTIHKSMENRRSQQQIYEQRNFNSLPIWIIIMSNIQIFIYMIIFIPIASLIYIIDATICSVLHAVSWLIHFMKLQLYNL